MFVGGLMTTSESDTHCQAAEKLSGKGATLPES